MTPAQLKALIDAADKDQPFCNLVEAILSRYDAVVAAAPALTDLWSALRSTGYIYRPDSEDPVERRIADALRRLEELP